MTLTANTVTKNFVLEEFVYNTVTDGEHTLDLTDCKGEVDLVLDGASASADATVTLLGGDYVGKADDTAYTVPAGKCMRISVSSAEILKTDGNLHVLCENASGLRVGAIKRRYVTNH